MSNIIFTGVNKTLLYNSQVLNYGGEKLLFYFLGDNVFKVNELTFNETDMDEATITCSIYCPADKDPKFSFDWYIDFNGERFFNKTLLPAASKTTDSLQYEYTLTFVSEREDLKRDVFANLVTGDNQPRTEYDFAFIGNIEQFASRFNLNLKANMGDRWEMIVSEGVTSTTQTVVCSKIKLWDLLKNVYTLYELRWKIYHDNIRDKMVILIMSEDDVVEIDHEFEYGSNNGLIEIERLNPVDKITTRLSGRGGTRNLLDNYFHTGDPDSNEHTLATHYTNLMPKCYRDYVKGWNGTLVTPETPAYIKGISDKVTNTWNPVDYVDSENMEIYGRWKDTLEDKEDIYPTIQGLTDSVLGRLDEVVAVEAVLNDDYEDDEADRYTYSDVADFSISQFLGELLTVSGDVTSEPFSVANNNSRVSFHTIQTPNILAGRRINYTTDITVELINNSTQAVVATRWLTGSIVDYDVKNISFSDVFTNVGAGEYVLKVTVTADNTTDRELNVTDRTEYY